MYSGGSHVSCGVVVGRVVNVVPPAEHVHQPLEVAVPLEHGVRGPGRRQHVADGDHGAGRQRGQPLVRHDAVTAQVMRPVPLRHQTNNVLLLVSLK